jgi:hypothetical protein
MNHVACSRTISTASHAGSSMQSALARRSSRRLTKLAGAGVRRGRCRPVGPNATLFGAMGLGGGKFAGFQFRRRPFLGFVQRFR